jgi:hypothetical protein
MPRVRNAARRNSETGTSGGVGQTLVYEGESHTRCHHQHAIGDLIESARGVEDQTCGKGSRHAATASEYGRRGGLPRA